MYKYICVLIMPVSVSHSSRRQFCLNKKRGYDPGTIYV